MDWNNDGRHDWQDHAFYNNVVSPSDKSESPSDGKYTNKNRCQNESKTSLSNGTIIMFVLVILYFLVKLISG